MRIRKYTPGDLDVCRSLWAEMVQQHRDIYDDQSIGGDDPGLEFDKHLELVGLDRIWLAETEGDVIGFTSLIIKDQEAEIEPVVQYKLKAINQKFYSKLDNLVKIEYSKMAAILKRRPILRQMLYNPKNETPIPSHVHQ